MHFLAYGTNRRDHLGRKWVTIAPAAMARNPQYTTKRRIGSGKTPELLIKVTPSTSSPNAHNKSRLRSLMLYSRIRSSRRACFSSSSSS